MSPFSPESYLFISHRYHVPYPGGLSNGAAAGITLAVLVAFCLAVIAPIAWCKRQKRLRREEIQRTSEDAHVRLVIPEQEDKLGRL